VKKERNQLTKGKSPKGKTVRRKASRISGNDGTLDPLCVALRESLQAVARRSSSGEAAAIEELWKTFNYLSGMTAVLADQNPRALDKQRLANVTVRCLHMLKVALGRSDAGALRVALGLTAEGCDLLQQTAQRDPEFVASFAESAASWPVMTAAKASYRKAADKYLQSIRVGTKSIPRTTKSTHVNTSKVRTSDLAAMILKQMRLYKSLLERFGKGITWPEGSLRTAEQNLRILEAKDFRCELLKLNRKSTPLELWKVGRRVLYRYWDRNPEQARKDIKLLSRWEGGGDRKSERTLAMELVRRAFYTAVKLVE
jgi:hypothetical protein